jgi:hypothetical protein
VQLRRTVVASVVLAATLGVTATATQAVQTSRFGLEASGTRTKLLHPAGDGAVHDSVVVYNLTPSPLTVDLGVVGVTAKPDGSYELGTPGQGLAAAITLETDEVTLAGHERRTVAVTIRRPSHTSVNEYAAITAQAASTGPTSGVGVQEQLAVLVGITAGGDNGVLHNLAHDPGRLAAVVVAVVLVVLATVNVLRRRRVLSSRNAARP